MNPLKRPSALRLGLLPSPLLRQPLLLRLSSSTSTPPSPSSSPPPPAPRERSVTGQFYRQLVPSMLHCLALGSIVYYALELLWSHLESEVVIGELQGQVKELEERLDAVRWGGEVEEEASRVGSSGRSWWKMW
ncbi:hypothetical protein RQP46_010146 [Phenoliferia psychrophenolica]